MSLRLSVRIAGAALAACLAAGCVLQPVDESAVVGFDPQLGATAAPVDPAEAERVADEAQTLAERHVSERRHTGVWTAPRRQPRPVPTGPVGLIRDESSSDTATDDAPRKPRTRTRSEPEDRDTVVRKPRDGRNSGDAGETGGGSNDGGTDDGGTENGGTDDGGSDPRVTDDDETQPDDKPSPRPRPEQTFQALGGASDARGDATGESPKYADITELLIESNGPRARVTVAVAAAIPDALDSGEVQGIGIDFYRSDDVESDYQLFIDGDDGGWRAFLQSPDGVVAYPGSFGVGGRVFVLEIPWESLGGRQPARVSMFVDWSKRDTPINRAGNDRAPDEGKVRIDPR